MIPFNLVPREIDLAKAGGVRPTELQLQTNQGISGGLVGGLETNSISVTL